MRVRRLKWHTLQCQSSQMALVVKNPLANARDARDSGSIAGWGISSGGRNGNPLQYSCLENPMGRGAWQATVHRIANSRTWLKLVTMHYYTVPGTLLFHSKRYLWILITLFEWINWLLLLLLSRFSCVRLCAAYQVPWDSPGKNTGVGCHFLLQCMKVKSESEVAQSCPTLSDPMDCSLPGSSVHGISQASVMEWGAIAFSDFLLYCSY